MPLEAFDDDRLARDENLAGNAHAGLIHDLGAAGRAIGHAQAQRPCFRIENDRRCGRRNPCRSVRSESKELSEDWNPRCGPIPAAMRCRVSMYGTGFIKPADDCSDIRIKKGTGREARFKSLVRYRVHQCEEKNGTVGPPHP